MGASTFYQFQQGEDLQTAFRAACEQARYEHGHGGYTGTLAEKHDVVISRDPVDLATARARAEQLIDAAEQHFLDQAGATSITGHAHVRCQGIGAAGGA